MSEQAQNSPPQATPQVPALNNIPLPVEDERLRHVTGGSKDEDNHEDEHELLKSPGEEMAVFHDVLTPDMEKELLDTQEENTSTPRWPGPGHAHCP